MAGSTSHPYPQRVGSGMLLVLRKAATVAQPARSVQEGNAGTPPGLSEKSEYMKRVKIYVLNIKIFLN